MSGSINREIAAHIVVDGFQSRGHSSAFLYNPENDPYAVQWLINRVIDDKGNTELVRWEFARELLLPDGEGPLGHHDIQTDVIIRFGEFYLTMRLESPDGIAFVEFLMSEVKAFTDAIYKLVPSGGEFIWIDMDSELDKLLNR